METSSHPWLVQRRNRSDRLLILAWHGPRCRFLCCMDHSLLPAPSWHGPVAHGMAPPPIPLDVPGATLQEEASLWSHSVPEGTALCCHASDKKLGQKRKRSACSTGTSGSSCRAKRRIATLDFQRANFDLFQDLLGGISWALLPCSGSVHP